MQQAAAVTEPFTKFINSKIFRSEFAKAAVDILDACAPGGIFIDEFGRGIDIGTGISLLNHVSIENMWSPMVRKVFVQCFATAEQGVSGSGMLACFVLSQLVIRETPLDVCEISKKSRYATSEMVEELIGGLLDDLTGDAFLDIVDHIGTSGKINILMGSKSKCALEVFSSHIFHFGVDPAFCTQSIKRDHGLIFLVDGAIEKVSEIDNILQHCHANKSTLFLVARKFGNEVISTLNMNFQQQMLDVIPIKVNDDISHINVFSDIAVSTLSTVINEASGLTASAFDPHNMSLITGIKCSHKNFSYSALKDASRDVHKRIKDLEKRAAKEHVHGLMSDEDIKAILTRRIDTLSTNVATLWLPANSMKTGLYSYINSKFKFAFGLLDSLCKTGMIKIDNDKLLSIFGVLKTPFLPASILLNSIETANNIMSSLDGVGGCVVIERTNRQSDSQ